MNKLLVFHLSLQNLSYGLLEASHKPAITYLHSGPNPKKTFSHLRTEFQFPFSIRKNASAKTIFGQTFRMLQGRVLLRFNSKTAGFAFFI